jgi:hypothetical protein
VEQDDPHAAGAEDVQVDVGDEERGDQQYDVGPCFERLAEDGFAGHADGLFPGDGLAERLAALFVGDAVGGEQRGVEELESAVEVEGPDVLAEPAERLDPALVNVSD